MSTARQPTQTERKKIIRLDSILFIAETLDLCPGNPSLLGLLVLALVVGNDLAQVGLGAGGKVDDGGDVEETRRERVN
jgi:hypothetical protein